MGPTFTENVTLSMNAEWTFIIFSSLSSLVIYKNSWIDKIGDTIRDPQFLFN